MKINYHYNYYYFAGYDKFVRRTIQFSKSSSCQYSLSYFARILLKKYRPRRATTLKADSLLKQRISA